MKPDSAVDSTHLFYTGPSMNPLLRENDLLEIAPCGPSGAAPGDVIAFEDQDAQAVVVHRVVAIAPRGLTTRGDNNARVDGAPVRATQVIGRVVTAWRGSAKLEIAGGRRGLLAAGVLRLRRACRCRVAPLLRVPWRLFRAARACLAPPSRRKTLAVTFASGDISVTRLIAVAVREER